MLGHLPVPFESCQNEGGGFLRHIITGDETVWQYRDQTLVYGMETCTRNFQSKESVVFQPTVRKVLFTVFWDSQWPVLEHLERGTVGNSVQCCKMCYKLKPTL
jgi:hypothetical protein